MYSRSQPVISVTEFLRRSSPYKYTLNKGDQQAISESLRGERRESYTEKEAKDRKRGIGWKTEKTS